MTQYTRVDLRLATPDDMHLPAYDYTKLTAINQCPVWGIIRYSKHKTSSNIGRATALEAGKAMHEAFAGIRLWQLGYTQGMMEHAQVHAVRLYGTSRWEQLVSAYESADCQQFALEVLATAGYIDDPYDKRRTYANLETSLLYYLQRWDFDRYPIWVRDAGDPNSDVGIEIPFAVRCDYYVAHDSVSPSASFLYTGRIDGIHTTGAASDRLIVGENKTASRLNDAWKMSFDVNHQPTGYCVAGSLFTGTHIDRALVWGISIPLPRMLHEGYALENVTRPQYMKARWLDWMYHTVMLEQQHINDPLNAPRYTHSCNRYFRPCAFIPLCNADDDEQRLEYERMRVDEWSPLHKEVAD